MKAVRSQYLRTLAWPLPGIENWYIAFDIQKEEGVGLQLSVSKQDHKYQCRCRSGSHCSSDGDGNISGSGKWQRQRRDECRSAQGGELILICGWDIGGKSIFDIKVRSRTPKRQALLTSERSLPCRQRSTEEIA